MQDKKFDINNLRVASPCSVGWETMTGNERVRRCSSCELNIFNTVELTTREVERLIHTHEGRLCIRMYRRADGTVLTRDCPHGLLAVRKRVARFGGAILATVLGLFSVSFAQKEDKKSIGAPKSLIIRTFSQLQETDLTGSITDPNGAVFPFIEVKLYKKGNKKPLKSKANKDGLYVFKALPEGFYELVVKKEGFKSQRIIEIEVKKNENISLNLLLEPRSITETVGIYTEEPLIDTTSSTIKTVITRRMMENLPH